MIGRSSLRRSPDSRHDRTLIPNRQKLRARYEPAGRTAMKLPVADTDL